MRELRTEIEIEAAAPRVWEVLTDLASYPEWNPFVRRGEGKLAVGERLHVFIQPPGGQGMSFRPRVLVADLDRELRWLGHLWIPGLFDGEHSFAIEPLGPGRVRFVHSEKFGGILRPFLWKMLDTDTRRGFEAMNVALKQRCEARVRS